MSRLPKSQLGKVTKVIKQFQENPNHPSINLHSVGESMLDERIQGARLDEAYRIILLPSSEKNIFIFLYVDKHDLAYDWARTKKFNFSNKNGLFQITESNVLNQEESKSEDKKNRTNFDSNIPKLFDQFSDIDFFEAGVEPEYYGILRNLKVKEDLVRILNYFDDIVKSILCFMADGVPVKKALELSLLDEDDSVNSQNVSSDISIEIEKTQEDIQNKTSLKLSDFLSNDFKDWEEINSGNLLKFRENLNFEEIFKKGLSYWRIFLHPLQYKLTRRRFSGPLLFTGSAGTGKTVVLIHRLVHLLKQNPIGKILFLTFSANLTIEIKNLIHHLCELENIPATTLRKVEIASLYRFSESLSKRSGWNGVSIGKNDERIHKIWNSFELPSELNWSLADFIREYFELKEVKGIYDLDTYLTASRSGFPKITRDDRKKVWSLFEKFEVEMKKRSLRTQEQCVHEGRLYFERNQSQKYQHLFVDEIQDMSLEALKLFKSLVGYSENPENGITMAGDLNQRIYISNIQPKLAGIQLQGRSVRLRVNYRTSEQIRNFACSILNGISESELPSEVDSSIKGDYSTFSGPYPEFVNTESESESLKALSEYINQWKSAGIKENEIAIIYSDSEEIGIQSPLDKIRKSGISVFELTAFQEDRADIGGIRLGTVKRMKGLEFRNVIFLFSPRRKFWNSESNLSNYAKCEIYVGSTRARERLVVIA